MISLSNSAMFLKIIKKMSGHVDIKQSGQINSQV